ncbi:unnamed protein product, partial [Discosporangium mesarthrocarpum]
QVEPLALSAADGLNACIFAYGQTGSGKTHTMIGDPRGGESAGISYRTMAKLFQVLGHRALQVCANKRWLFFFSFAGHADDGGPDGYSFSVKVAMLEIYNDDVRDLLRGEASSGPVSGAG